MTARRLATLKSQSMGLKINEVKPNGEIIRDSVSVEMPDLLSDNVFFLSAASSVEEQLGREGNYI